MTNSIQRRNHVSLAIILEAKDITPEEKVSYALDIGAATSAIRNCVERLGILPDAEEILAECDRIRGGCEG
ncbi:hypothetical protein HN512_04060 [Candidatus Peregrinibacteria bacterium]|jgi:hypothetical protein|nr:hypothetical protein [Candidatus Peregrinibacteria bacterium]MBT3598984.1 hypothetical protein [Candidatus Peregrinibacteria bacterium]MBT4585490.1 hypothetical protein [Candidatus Peregrinibacteria bacterium]MBT6731305.1 hypothetical protein [Candidatus Peregrinibacteria bacterium]MBT7009731.1 hypothetical protein [Candidatus Peregrinibacteria bacterium]